MNRALICHSLLEEKPRTLVRGECHKTVAIVTHGGPIRRILWELIGIEKEQSEIKIADCACAVLEYKDGKFFLIEKEGIEFV
mgnify:FL=1